ncbi:RNA pseudouridylate synthase [Trypanosoma grayi]|uniref:RNA pseudouridylate synthase n=1 Tax=Trypanosoma grayi TaxID=71804 RepID=UPI0004F3FF56|nr:RNA pseudouridylate synthase [Trypanosoma grayi]KEG13259.1 RNA pseudouridylate synthase [Trypanosoma grayi]
MHQVRGLVRRSSAPALRLLEKRIVPHDVTTCFVGAAFVDGEGVRAGVQLLHPSALLQLLEDMPKSEALLSVREAKKAVLASGDAAPPHAALRATSSSLCVKYTTPYTIAELRRRQLRFLAKTEGRLMAHDLPVVEAFTQGLLARTNSGQQQHQQQKGEPQHEAFHPEEVVVYRGIVEELARINPPAALALAINRKLPSLGSGASAALAQLVSLDKSAALLSFLEGFAEKDEMSTASETCATQVAIRLRNKLWELREASPTDPTKALLGDSLAVACRFNVDPGAVFPTDAGAIQRWSSQFLQDSMWPMERAAVISDIVRRKQLMPRRVSLDCLSSWCLNDLERPWLSGLLGTCQNEAMTNSPMESVYRSALACALKEPKRYLVDSRLLQQYAALLRGGDMEPTHPSFAHFIEECGECHDDTERPAELSFLLQVTQGTVMDALVALAPQCSYWRTLLSMKQDGNEAFVAPQGHVRVTVKLPRVHECVEAAMRTAGASSSLCLSVLYEDEDLVVFNKPPHMATSRHALSCTQLGDATVTDIVSLVLASPERGRVVRGVFRQGQVHRLDTETSGCLIMAKSDCAATSLRHQMGTSAAYAQNNKVYLALCAVLEPDLSRIPLQGVLRDPLDVKITTRYRVVRFFRQSRVALVECRIQQGKKHQIRRHLATAGLPILQDLDHGGAACCTPVIQRVALHAAALTIVHPRTANVITFVAPLTADFQEAIRQLK